MLMAKSVLKLLGENCRTLLALDKSNNNIKEEQQKHISEILEKFLGRDEWPGKRASKMDLVEFLSIFNENNLDFQ